VAKHTGRGISAIEYPTGMNQNGDPSQAWIKIKPTAASTCFRAPPTSERLEDDPEPDRRRDLGVPYDWITYDNSNTDSSPVCTGTFASRATFVAGNAVLKAAADVKVKLLAIAAKELEISPDDLEIVDGEVIAKGSPQKKIGVPDVAAAATWTHGELLTGTGAQLNPYAAIIEPETGKVDLPPHAAISYASCAAEVEVDDETGEVQVKHMWQCFDVGRAINPTLVEGQIQGGALMGLGLAVLEECYPYYPSASTAARSSGRTSPRGSRACQRSTRSSSRTPPPTARTARRGSAKWRITPSRLRSRPPVYDAVGVWVTELPITPERVLRALEKKAEGPRRDGKWVIFDEDISVNTVAAEGSRFRFPVGA
jgi:CO/xanthine dehydrogenase Mo-binding subunit